MALTADEKREVAHRFVRQMAELGESTALTRPQLAAVIGAVDTRVASGVVTISGQVATATAGAVTPEQIARLIELVLRAQNGSL